MKNTVKNNPLVSIIMPVFNAAAYLAEAITSIQDQTYSHWELIIVDDLSTDGSFELAQNFAQNEARISVYRNGRHRGVAGVANLALEHAHGKLIARIDADDIAYPDRIQKQVTYLQAHPEVVALGGQCLLIDQHGEVIGEKQFPTDSTQVYQMMFHSIGVQQPSLMVNLNKLPADFVWYENGLNTAEEVELLFKFFRYGIVTNLPDFILKYRLHGHNTSLSHPKDTFYATFRTRLAAIKKYGYKPTFIGLVITFSQLVIISVMPSRYIYPLYSLVRGLKKRATYHLGNFVKRDIAVDSLIP